MAPLLVFDLDGTLVDSVPDLTAALNRLMAARGLAPFGDADVAPMVGDGAGVLVQRAFAARGVAADQAALDAYAADYGQNYAVATCLYPGVADTLAQLTETGWHLAVCTNKPAVPARKLLDTLGVGGRFAAIGGGDSFPTRKPDPAHLKATIEVAGGTPDRALMVGDHANDIRAATGVGIPCIYASWGYGGPAMATGSAEVAARFSSLPEIATRLLNGAAR